MTPALLLKHLEAAGLALRSATAQLDLIRQALTPQPLQTEIPARCAGVPADGCALRSEDAQRPLMGGVVVCLGCQERLTERPPTEGVTRNG